MSSQIFVKRFQFGQTKLIRELIYSLNLADVTLSRLEDAEFSIAVDPAKGEICFYTSLLTDPPAGSDQPNPVVLDLSIVPGLIKIDLPEAKKADK